jgi:hypothetical protein
MSSIDAQQKQRTGDYNLIKGQLTNLQRKRVYVAARGSSRPPHFLHAVPCPGPASEDLAAANIPQRQPVAAVTGRRREEGRSRGGQRIHGDVARRRAKVRDGDNDTTLPSHPAWLFKLHGSIVSTC